MRRVRTLRIVFGVVILLLAAEMIFSGITRKGLARMDDRRLEIHHRQSAARRRAAGRGRSCLAGGVFYLAQFHAAKVDFQTFTEESASLRRVGGIFHSALALHSGAIIQFGLLLLIATPVARVVFAAIGFYLERDRMYTMVSLIVLAVLIFSLMHAT